MNTLCIRLEAHSPDKRCHRAYRIEAGPDLFGVWLVGMTYGRIGTKGRVKGRSFAGMAEARAQVEACLKRRATAPRRIGVAYQLRLIACEGEWSDLAVRSLLLEGNRAPFPGPHERSNRERQYRNSSAGLDGLGVSRQLVFSMTDL